MSKLKPARIELLSSEEYHATTIRSELFAEVETYLKKEGMTRNAFADKLGVTKSYITQVLKGDANIKVSKLVQLSLATGKVPVLSFVALSDYLAAEGKVIAAKPESKSDLAFVGHLSIQRAIAPFESAHAVSYVASDFSSPQKFSYHAASKQTTCDN